MVEFDGGRYDFGLEVLDASRKLGPLSNESRDDVGEGLFGGRVYGLAHGEV